MNTALERMKKRRDEAKRRLALRRECFVPCERFILPELPKGDPDRLRADVSTGAWKWRAPYTAKSRRKEGP